MADTPSALSGRPSLRHSGAKRPRASTVEFDPDELQTSLGVSSDYLILGIDEAGRGPVIGPMVYTGAVVSLAEHDSLIELCHVADSKTLDATQRESSLQQLQSLKTFRPFTVSITAETISSTMTGRDGRTLNSLSHEAAIQIITEATLASAGKLCAVYVDTVGPPDRYEERLTQRFPHLRVTVAKQADQKYPIVSAASIVAKTTRDAAVTALGEDVGSGYPSDPRAMRWIHSHLHRFFVHRRCYSFVRQSWGPVMQLANDPAVCVSLTFAQDEENESRPKGRLGSRAERAATHPSQPKLSFTAAKLPKRHSIYTNLLRLSTPTNLGEAT